MLLGSITIVTVYSDKDWF